MASDDDDAESEQTKNNKSFGRCEFCNVNIRSVVKCSGCSDYIHTKCFENMMKYINLSKQGWKCKTCIASMVTTDELTASQADMENIKDLKIHHLKRELNVVHSLNAELKTVNNLLQLRLSESEDKFKSNTVNIQPIVNSRKEMSPKPSYNEILKREVSKNAVLIIESKDSKCNVNTFKTNVKPSDLGQGISNIKETNNGKLIIQCENSEQREKIKMNLEKTIGKNYTLMVPDKYNPRIKIFNAEISDTSNDQLIENIYLLNKLDEDYTFKIVKIITNQKFNKRCTIIAETDPNLFKKLINQGYLYVEWRKCYIRESFNIIRCFNCNAFGHMKTNCPKQNSVVCYKCGGNHRGSECTSSVLKCPNCCTHNLRSNYKYDTNHSASESHCPSYSKQIEFLRSRVNYEQSQ